MQHGLVFNLQRCSIHDGPGIRTTVFLKGCPLRCAWCHNPEGISPAQEIVVLEDRCIGCGECRRVCPIGAEAPAAAALPPRQERCQTCGRCVEACPTRGRQMAGRQVSAAELLEAILADRVFYEESGGGVTFSGGEPLAQPEFLRTMLTEAKARGLHTAVDTCGFVKTSQLLGIAPLTDLFLFDLKLMDDARHRQFTGVSNGIILDNLRALSCVHSRIWLRVPVIPGVNDAAADLEATARFAAGLQGIRQVNLLPYHRTGVPKSRRLGLAPVLPATDPPSAEVMGAAVAIFKRQGLPARIGG